MFSSSMGSSSSTSGSLYEFLEPMFGAENLAAEVASDNFFVRLFEVLVSNIEYVFCH